MTGSLLLFGIACALAMPGAVAADATPCPVSDKAFLRQITADNDWPAVHAVFTHNLPACRDDGLYADGYTSMVVATLAAHWSDLRVAEQLFAEDKGFRGFVFAHIGAAAAEADLQRVLTQAQAGCPARSAALCGELQRRVRAALAAQR